jgi:3-oxoacyl-[acyl-carrier-protein] synthase III
MFAAVPRSAAHFVPERVVTNEDLARLMDTSNDWIVERTGIRERRFVAPESAATSILACQAAQLALDRAGWTPRDVDYLIVATLSPDYYFPGLGTIVQHRLGCATIPALDIRAQCSGFVYGVSVVDAVIRSGQARKVLLICAEVQSPVLDLTTRGREMAVLFGDGAGAVTFEAERVTESPAARGTQRGVIDSLLGSDGSGAEVLCLKVPGTAHPGFLTKEDIEQAKVHPQMDGRAVFKNAVTRMAQVSGAICERNGVSPADLDLVVPHQANLRINEALRQYCGLRIEQIFNNIERYGNTTAATIPICLSEAAAEGRLKSGQLVLTVAFGAGFTWGANLIRW